MDKKDANSNEYKLAFSIRLKQVLKTIDEKLLSPSVLQREFNRRSRHTKVGVTAVQKWLSGDSIPQQEKLVVLATWLLVSAHWLRFGEESQELNSQELLRNDRLIKHYSQLSDRDKMIVEWLIENMIEHS